MTVRARYKNNKLVLHFQEDKRNYHKVLVPTEQQKSALPDNAKWIDLKVNEFGAYLDSKSENGCIFRTYFFDFPQKEDKTKPLVTPIPSGPAQTYQMPLSKMCWHQTTPIHEGDDGLKLYIGPLRTMEVEKLDLLIDCTGAPEAAKHELPAEFRDMTNLLESPEVPTIYLDIRDYSIPYIRDEFWPVLYGRLKTKPRSVGIGCMGGHGRSGTVAAILLGMDLNLTGEVAIATLRTVYCKEAVESKEQEAYVCDILRIFGYGTPEEESKA